MKNKAILAAALAMISGMFHRGVDVRHEYKEKPPSPEHVKARLTKAEEKLLRKQAKRLANSTKGK